MGVQAAVVVKNQTNSAINITISETTNIDGVDGLNNRKLDPYKSSDPVVVKTTGITQSHFQINYLGGGMGIDLGLFLSNTGVTSNSNPKQIRAVLAPNRPVVDSFKFYFYGGPGVVTPLINSVINANLSALKKALPALIYSFFDGAAKDTVKNIITSVELSGVQCSYAAAVPAGQNQLDVSAILSVSGAVSGNLGVVLSVTDLAVLIEGRIDLSSDKPKIEVTSLACSLERYEAATAVVVALVAVLPTLGPIGILMAGLLGLAIAMLTPIAVAGSINDTDLNKKIVDSINNELKKI